MRFLHGLLRSLLYYFVFYPFKGFFVSIKKRMSFERKNLHDIYAQIPQDFQADYAFEISSEGELEQVRYLIEFMLQKGLKVQLIYSSESVENRCQELAAQYRGKLYILRFPFLNFHWPSEAWYDISKWLNAPILILCRYDFFPELFLYARQPDKKIYLLSATGKGLEKKLNLNASRLWFQVLYHSFDKIVAATHTDAEKLQSRLRLENIVGHYDFRCLAIYQRLEKREQTLESKFPHISAFNKLIKKYPHNQRMIWGSFWFNEVECFDNEKLVQQVQDRKLLCCIAPHNLDYALIGKIKRYFLEHNIPLNTYHIYPGITEAQMSKLMEEFHHKPGVILINVKGVLLELYSLFGHAFVGGGHGKSVHSLLEPFLANCQLYCGPLVHRSTEYDFIMDMQSERIAIVEDMRSFYDTVNIQKAPQDEVATNITKDLQQGFGTILKSLDMGHA
jgi:3-deoxy-D-manno-octulosonic-acid transferase